MLRSMVEDERLSPEVVQCIGCGLVQLLPHLGHRQRAVCAQCGAGMPRRIDPLMSRSRTLAVASAALILYPFAMALPLLKVDRLGESHASTAWSAAVTLLEHDHLWVGLLIILCSLIIPVVKLVVLIVLALGRPRLSPRVRAIAYRSVEISGRWGMIDVLLVAVLVATIKLGDVAAVRVGSGLLLFTAVVGLSILAANCFDPRLLWSPSNHPASRR